MAGYIDFTNLATVGLHPNLRHALRNGAGDPLTARVEEIVKNCLERMRNDRASQEQKWKLLREALVKKIPEVPQANREVTLRIVVEGAHPPIKQANTKPIAAKRNDLSAAPVKAPQRPRPSAPPLWQQQSAAMPRAAS
jgi:vancomycin resistance protein YoaR